jgi:nitroreductase
MIQKPADTTQTLDKTIAERWSGRAYDPNIAVSEEMLTAIMEAAQWAPSCFGEAPWRFLVCNKFTHPEAWHKAFDALVESNQAWAVNAPILILAAASTHFSHNGKPNRYNGYDTGSASLNLCLQATAFGLMSHQMGGFDANKMRTSFDIPEEIELWAMIAIGHPAALDTLSEEALERELKPRERRPLEQQFYLGEWISS